MKRTLQGRNARYVEIFNEGMALSGEGGRR